MRFLLGLLLPVVLCPNVFANESTIEFKLEVFKTEFLKRFKKIETATGQALELRNPKNRDEALYFLKGLPIENLEIISINRLSLGRTCDGQAILIRNFQVNYKQSRFILKVKTNGSDHTFAIDDWLSKMVQSESSKNYLGILKALANINPSQNQEEFLRHFYNLNIRELIHEAFSNTKYSKIFTKLFEQVDPKEVDIKNHIENITKHHDGQQVLEEIFGNTRLSGAIDKHKYILYYAINLLSMDYFPTRDQILSFMYHVSDEHSWYKHLPKGNKREDPLKNTTKGYKFKFYLSSLGIFEGSLEDDKEFGPLSYTIWSQENYNDIEGIEFRFNDQNIYFFLTSISYDRNERMEQEKNCRRIADAIEENLRKTYLSFKKAQSDVETYNEILNTAQNYLEEELRKADSSSENQHRNACSTGILGRSAMCIPRNTAIVSTALLILLSVYASTQIAKT